MALAGAELENGPLLSWDADPPLCPSTTWPSPQHRQRTHPRDPRCPPCPVLAAVGGRSPALARWGGGFPGGRSPDPGEVPQPGTAQLPNVAICLCDLRSHLLGVRRAEGPGGPGAQLQHGEGAEEAQPSHTAQAAHVGRIWVRSVKGRRGGPAPSTPSGSPAPQPFVLGKGLTAGCAAPLCCQIKHGEIAISSPSSPCPQPHRPTRTSAAPEPAQAPHNWFLPASWTCSPPPRYP